MNHSKSDNARTSVAEREWLRASGMKVLLMSSAAFLLPLVGASLQAQEVQTSQSIEEIVVQGTATGTGIRGVAPVGSQTLSISREDLLESPVRNAAEIIATLPQGSQDRTGVASADGGNTQGAGGLNLRGLGGDASLMLLNGNRMAGQGVSSIAPDPNAIPFAAIERVEVVLDGASSVYGSDAVAGVVNFRMRRDFEGVNLQVSGLSGLYDTAKIEMVAGHTWDNANLMVGLSKEYVTPMMRNERDYLMQDLRQFGGNDGRISGNGSPGPNALIRMPGNNANPLLNFRVVDPGWVGETVTVHDGVTLAVPVRRPLLSEVRQATLADFVDSGDFAEYRGSSDNRNAFVSAGFQLSDDMRVDYTGMISKRETRTTPYSTTGFNITRYSPYRIPGLVSSSSSNYSVRFEFTGNGQRAYGRNYVRTQNHYVDFTWDIAEFQWTTTAYWGSTKGCDICRTEVNNAAITHDPTGTPVGYKNYLEVGVDANGFSRGNNPEWFNPYLSGPNNPDQPNFDNRLVGDTYRAGDQWQTGIRTRFEGPLMELPGGTVRGSVGAEYLDQGHWLWLNQTVRYYPTNGLLDYVLRDTTVAREVGSVYGEVYVPLVGDGNAMPGVQRLALNLSVRNDEYSDFGGTTNPRVGLTWDVNDDITLRGSYGTSFKAPNLVQTNPGTGSVLSNNSRVVGADVTDVDTSNQLANGSVVVFTRSGSNPELGPETATNWSVGLEYTPYQVEGLDISLTYYDIAYEDRIENLPNSNNVFIDATNRERYRSFVTLFTQPATCVAGDTSTYSPILMNFLDGPGYTGTRITGDTDDCDAVAVVSSGLQNVGTMDQSGVDAQVSYTWDNSYGLWRASINAAKILELERTLSTGGAPFTALDKIGWQNSLRVSGRVSWAYDNWSSALSFRREGGYLNDNTPNVVGVGQLPDQNVPDWTTYDLTVSYSMPDDGTLLSGISGTLGIQNLLDEDPPIVLNGSNGFDANKHNAFGRMIRLELSKSF